MGVELDVEPPAMRVGDLGRAHEMELPAFEPGLAHAERPAMRPQRIEPLPLRQRLDPADHRAAILPRPARSGDEIVYRNIDHRQIAPRIPGGGIERRGKAMPLEHRQHVAVGRGPAIIDRDHHRGTRQAVRGEPLDCLAQRQHRQARSRQPRHARREPLGRHEQAAAKGRAGRQPQAMIAKDAQLGAGHAAGEHRQAGPPGGSQQGALGQHR
ncbi:MAG: hypothetical protein J0I39_11555 [Sphingomonas sp.]|nr:MULTISPECIES: hypothetical protein [unclassified Sphingomonas]MBN8811929.1 hypothetical protein [Sphingomonas sp.]